MAEQIFKPGYYPAGEEKFREALEQGDYKHAADILEKFPTGRNTDEEVQRAVALVQGYRHLSKVLISHSPDLDKINDMQQQYGELEVRYGELSQEANRLNEELQEEREESRTLRKKSDALEGSLKQAQADLSKSGSSRRRAESALAFLWSQK